MTSTAALFPRITARLRRSVPMKLALAWVVLLTLAAVTADLWVPMLLGDPRVIDTSTAVSTRLQPSSVAHPLGTDDFGRDILARVIYGARVSLTTGVLAVLISAVIGVVGGGLAGYYGRWIDLLVMRACDVFLAVPYVLFALLILAMLPPGARGPGPVILAVGLLGWPTFARLFRGSVLAVSRNQYVEAARAVGASDLRILVRHIAPNAIAPVVAVATMSVGGAILAEAALSFLGLGVQPPAISWGQMIESGRSQMATSPGLVVWPGLAITATVLAFTVLGDNVRESLGVRSGHGG